MSEWRDIWKRSVIANSIMSRNLEKGIEGFAYLLREFGDDGMLYYAMAESYEYHHDRQNAIVYYKKAMDLFPVMHWKKVAEATIQRVTQNKSADTFFDTDNFEDKIWFGFQKIYELIYLDDFVRYVSLSAFSRASSEWTLSLVDFRTVLELQIKNDFPQIVEEVKKRSNDFSLFELIKELENQNYIDKSISYLMHQIRKAGNLAAHNSETIERDKNSIIQNFIDILEFFNETSEKQSLRI